MDALAGPPTLLHDVRVPAAGVVLHADLAVPAGAEGIVLFAHGSGSSRHSPRNRMVAETLRRRALATVLDLLTADEAAAETDTGGVRFDIPLLAGRLAGAAEWLAGEPATAALELGCFGASTGAAAALLAAARSPERFAAVVSRGGRPDLAGEALERVAAPTLLIVGGADEPVLTWNRQAAGRMSASVEVVVIPEATHLFAEPGALERVAQLAGDWFSATLRAREE